VPLDERGGGMERSGGEGGQLTVGQRQFSRAACALPLSLPSSLRLLGQGARVPASAHNRWSMMRRVGCIVDVISVIVQAGASYLAIGNVCERERFGAVLFPTREKVKSSYFAPKREEPARVCLFSPVIFPPSLASFKKAHLSCLLSPFSHPDSVVSDAWGTTACT